MLVSFTFRLAVECAACRISLPVNGIVSSVRCYHCGETNEYDASWWKFVIEPDHLASALGFAEGEAQESRVMSKRGNYVYAYGKRAPRCQACKGPDLDLASLAGFVADGRCFCPGCGQAIRVRPADELCLAISDRACLVVHESAADPASQAVQAQTRPVIFACMGCGGGLAVDGKARSVECQFCRAPNYLPDGLWQQLHPVPKPQPFFLICDHDDASMRDLRWTSGDARALDATSAALDPAELARLAVDPEDAVRRAVAGNPVCPAELLERLSTDRERDVRAAAAGNPATPLAALLHLAADDSEDVWRSLCIHAGQHAEVVDQLARHPGYRARKLAAGHPSLPFATLHQLAGDGDDEVKAEARGRLKLLRDQGVDVDAGRGFFAKLFG